MFNLLKFTNPMTKYLLNVAERNKLKGRLEGLGDQDKGKQDIRT
jgi:hypothetical protein